MEKIKLWLLPLIVVIGLTSCGKQNNPQPVTVLPGDTIPTVIPPPSATALSAPANGQPCTTGTAVSSNVSTVTFSWLKTGANTDTYELHIKNLLTSDSIVTSTALLSINVNLSTSTPYSWYIIAKQNNSTKTAQSETWKFYNSGPGLIVYPPYPADILSPAMMQNVVLPGVNTAGGVTLKWEGTAGSNPIKNYDVYFGTDASPPLSQSQLTDNTAQYLVYGGNTYYWKIVTRDNTGNTSTTQVYNFYVE